MLPRDLYGLFLNSEIRWAEEEGNASSLTFSIIGTFFGVLLCIFFIATEPEERILKLHVILSNSSFLNDFFWCTVLLLTMLEERTIDGEGPELPVFCGGSVTWGSGFMGLSLGWMIILDFVYGYYI